MQARAAAGGIEALSKDLVLSRVRECEVAALRARAEAAEASLVRVFTYLHHIDTLLRCVMTQYSKYWLLVWLHRLHVQHCA